MRIEEGEDLGRVLVLDREDPVPHLDAVDLDEDHVLAVPRSAISLEHPDVEPVRRGFGQDGPRQPLELGRILVGTELYLVHAENLRHRLS